MKKPKPSIIVILGPTASGKSDLAVQLATKLNGEVVSADSRQVYKGLDLGSGKITPTEMQGIPHHLLDVVDPNIIFSVKDFQDHAYKAIDDIITRGKLPIICGGTGFYIQAIVDGLIFPEVNADVKLRKELEQKSTEELFAELTVLDPKRAQSIDRHNKVRIIRALELIHATGSTPTIRKKPHYNALQIGIKYHDERLKERIKERIEKRIKLGMIEEVERLRKEGVSWKRLESFGLEYRFIAQYLQNKFTKEEMITLLATAIWHFAKRQMTWFKRDPRIWWIEVK